MNIIFFEENRLAFLPLVYTKPLAKIRFGILTIAEKWQKMLNNQPTVSYLTTNYLSEKYPLIAKQENIFINARFCPNKKIIDYILDDLNEALFVDNELVAVKCSLTDFKQKNFLNKKNIINFNLLSIENCNDLFVKNKAAIETDFQLITQGRTSQPIDNTNVLIGNNIFIEEGAQVKAAILNSTEGAIYIGKNAEVMEGTMIRGSFALCEHAVLKMGAKVYGPTTIGKYSKVGGELSNVVIQDFTNKGHDGFLGNSVIGEWCNLGADTNTSNLKNNYSNVKAWSYLNEKNMDTKLQFCGLIMGDHSKCGINTMFNTGTVVGVNANIFGGDFPPKFIPSYAWGGKTGFETYNIEKSFAVAEKVMERRAKKLTQKDKKILTAIFELSSKYRK